MAEIKTYGHEEIQRYLQQKMSRQEMHDFEKALMNDPFLADALEGYSAVDPMLSAQHLAAIEKVVIGEQQKAKVVPFNVTKTPWWNVAAVLLILVCSGAITWAVYKNSFNINQNKITQAVAVVEKNQKDSIRPANKSIAQVELLPPMENFESRKKSSPVIITNRDATIAYQKSTEGLGIETGDQVTANLSVRSLMASAAPENPNPKAAAAPVVSQNEFKGKIAETTGEGQLVTGTKANISKIGTTADSNRNFSLRAGDSVPDFNINSAGYSSAKAQVNSKKTEKRVALREEEASMALVVVTGMAAKKRTSPVSIAVDTTEAEPIGGWKDFNRYLNRRLDSLKSTSSAHHFSEGIELEFLIDKKGKPTHIKAPAELDKRVAEKAVQILSDGPRWKNKKKEKKVKVIITF